MYLQENQTQAPGLQAAALQDVTRRDTVCRPLGLLLAPGKASKEIQFQLTGFQSRLLVAEAAGDIRRTSPPSVIEAHSNQTCPSCRRALVE